MPEKVREGQRHAGATVIFGLSDWPDASRVTARLSDEAVRHILQKSPLTSRADPMIASALIREAAMSVELLRVMDRAERPSASEIRASLAELDVLCKRLLHKANTLHPVTKLLLQREAIWQTVENAEGPASGIAGAHLALTDLRNLLKATSARLPKRESTRRAGEAQRRYAQALAEHLMPVFQEVSGHPATLKVDGGDTGIGPFADFFWRVWQALEGDSQPPFDIKRVITAAKNDSKGRELPSPSCAD
jgi:hypothetical protein